MVPLLTRRSRRIERSFPRRPAGLQVTTTTAVNDGRGQDSARKEGKSGKTKVSERLSTHRSPELYEFLFVEFEQRLPGVELPVKHVTELHQLSVHLSHLQGQGQVGSGSGSDARG